MSKYYPQAAVIMRVVFEDNSKGRTSTTKLVQHVFTVQPKRVSVNINDYTQADTFSLEVDYKTFPFDPRTIRSCGVSVFIQSMGKLFRDDQSANRIVPSSGNIMFQGFADEETISFDDQHRSVRMEGRDFTGLLIDKKASGEPTNTTQPIEQYIRALLDADEALKPIIIDNRTGAVLPSVAESATDTSPKSSSLNQKHGLNVWEQIQDLVVNLGLIAYIEIDKLVITKPRILYGRESTKQFVYGKNLKTLEFKRKLGRKKGFNIRCISFNPVVDKKPQTIDIPREASEAWLKDINLDAANITVPQVGADGTKLDDKDAPFITFRFPNKTKKALIPIGEKTFEEVGRQQIEGSLTTNEMDVVDDVGKCFDITKMRNGTPIQITIDQGDLQGLARAGNQSAKIRFLTERCFDPKVAAALVKSLNQVHPLFYTKEVDFTVEAEGGFSLKVDFINFIQLDNRNIGNG